jgi:hypothetical protein
MRLKKGNIVRFFPDFEDGKEEYNYVLLEDPDGGRVKVMPVNSGLEFPPVQVVKTDWLIKVSR